MQSWHNIEAVPKCHFFAGIVTALQTAVTAYFSSKQLLVFALYSAAHHRNAFLIHFLLVFFPRTLTATHWKNLSLTPDFDDQATPKHIVFR